MGSSRVSVQHLIAESVIGSCGFTVIDRRSLGFHSGIEPPRRFIRMDVTNMDFADNSFDVILCNNILPYVRDDRRALSEIFRCLKITGLAMIDSEHNEGETRSADAYRREHPELGEDYFAVNGDQWVYGKDYFERLEAAGFNVRVDVLFGNRDSDFKRAHGLKDHHEAILAFKSSAGGRRFSTPRESRERVWYE